MCFLKTQVVNGLILIMNKRQKERFRALLIQAADDLRDQDSLGKDGQKTVTLDQQSVGRLSRMDALQQQAMAKATQGRRDLMHTKITAALARLDADEYGYCTGCGEDISTKRLELDPTALRCVSCASG